MSSDAVSSTYLGAFLIFSKRKILQKFHVRGICPFKMVITKCHVLLHCSVLLLMPCDVPLKVMHTAFWHVEKDQCKVEERQMKGRQRDTRRYRRRWTSRATDRTPDAYSLSHVPNQGLSRSPRWKSKTRILKSHFSLCLTNTILPPHRFVFFPPSFSFCLFHSPLPVSSPWSGGRQRVSALTQRSLQELLWLAVLCSTVHNRLRHGELPLTAFLCCSCGFDTVT